jgi:hypothetical protein
VFRSVDDDWVIYLLILSPLLFLGVLGVVGWLVQLLASAGCR